MNGRMYDPVLGRFQSPDNFVQDPYNSQSYNRYGYVLNNPLMYIDKDGELAFLAIMAIVAAVYGTGNLVAHAVRGDVRNFWDGLKYFGQGAVVGASMVAFTLVPIIGPAIGVANLIKGTITTASLLINTGYGIATGNWDRLKNSGKIWLGNFYLDENRSFFGGVWQGISRFTWEMPQQVVGYSFTQTRNMIGRVDKVEYFGGATFSIDEDFEGDYHGWGAVSLGNFINAKIRGKLDYNNPGGWIYSERGLFWHEYGHTFDSQIFGLSYLFAIGIPSATGAIWTEYRANTWAWKYAHKHGFMEDWMYPNRPLHE